MTSPKPLILFIDAYDSFSNNIISLLETSLNCSVRSIKIDNPALLASEEAFEEELSHYAAVVCGPGPGHPGNKQDVGVMSRVWKLDEAKILPVLGICLGFQSLCLEFGGEVKRLNGPQHGMIRRIIHVGELETNNTSIFNGVGELHATLYQSLCADIGQESEMGGLWRTSKWNSTKQCPDLMPLAWAESDGAAENMGVLDDRVLVAVRHRMKPFWALQYHPESICTSDESKKVIFNWFVEAEAWNCLHRKNFVCPKPPTHGELVVRESLLQKYERISHLPIAGGISPSFGLGFTYQSRTIDLPEYISVPDIAEAIQDLRSDQIILESSNAHETSPGAADVRGRYSIIALDIDDTIRFEYRTGGNMVSVFYPRAPRESPLQIDVQSYGGIWSFLAQFLEKRRTLDGLADSPFWGGFIGYTTYELGLEGIDVASKTRDQKSHSRPDLCFAWVTRSLVVDHRKNLIYLQDLAQDADQTLLWMSKMGRKIKALSLPAVPTEDPAVSSSHPMMASPNSSQASLNLKSTPSQSLPTSSKNSEYSTDSPKTPADAITSITTPSSTTYESKVRLCQEYIRAGSSYELCLTDQTTISRHRFDVPTKPNISLLTPSKPLPGPDAWHLYRTLRARQPAPFAAYIRLGASTFISASPERFLTYTARGKCSLRPMKGTVRKSPAVPTLADALPLLDIPKEKAENLMIVDLVRHDLYGVCGSGNVQVPRLMAVEEYKSVFQMISIVEGQIPVGDRNGKMYTGLDVLAASLPPGSMTGAPKKRSCEILQNVEDKERSLYSGVVGYMDVGGRGDWSVNIRCMFRWDDEDEVVEGKTIETWHIGAGGAVTALSTPEGEREEMLTKLNGTLGVFR